MADLKLKAALVGKFRTQTAASRELNITESRLSRLVNGWERPSEKELDTFAKAFGRSFAHNYRRRIGDGAEAA